MRKVLVVCLDNLGDTIMASAVIEPIKRRYPQARVSLWVKEHFAGLYEKDPLVEEVFAASPFWTASPNRRAGGFVRYFKTLRRIWLKNFDCCVIINACWRKALSLYFIPRRIGMRQKKSGLFLNYPINTDEAAGKSAEVVLKVILKNMLAEECELIPRINLPESYCAYADDFGHKYGLKGKNVFGMQLFSGDKRKDWDSFNYRRLAIEIKGVYNNSAVIVFCGPGEELKSARVFEGLDFVRVVKSSIEEMAALIKRCSLFFGPDSGPLHIAGAFDVPLVGYYSLTRSSMYKPFGRGEKVCLDVDIKDLTVVNILNKIESVKNYWEQRLWV